MRGSIEVTIEKFKGCSEDDECENCGRHGRIIFYDIDILPYLSVTVCAECFKELGIKPGK